MDNPSWLMGGSRGHMPIIALVFLTLALLGGGAALAAENGPGTTNSPLQVAVSNALSTPPVFLANPIAAPASGATNPAGEPAGDVQPTATPITGTIQITMTATISDVKAIDGFREPIRSRL
jgi:hypothetical protein